MKSYTLFFTLFVLFSCSTTQTIIDPISKKEVKVFENEEFSFYYPKNWEKFRMSHSKKEVIVDVAPSKELRSQVKFPPNYSYQQKKKRIEKLEKEYGFNASAKFSFIHFFISVDSLMFDNLEVFINDRKKNFNDKNNDECTCEREISFNKESETHFIEDYNITGTKPNRIYQNHLIHYIQKDKKIYTLSYSFILEKHTDYLQDVAIILNSFKFTDGTSLK